MLGSFRPLGLLTLLLLGCQPSAVAPVAPRASGPSAAVATVVVPDAPDSPSPAEPDIMPDRAIVTAREQQAGVHRLGTPRTVRWPVVTSGGGPAEAKLRASLTPKAIFGETVEEMVDNGHMEALDFTVLYNGRGLLSLELSYDGIGAYPSHWAERRTFELRDGSELTAEEALVRHAELAARVDTALQAAIVESGALDDEYCRELVADKHFEPSHLERFVLSAAGATFHHPGFGFPHAFLALEPNLDHPLAWAELAPFIRADGPLATFVTTSAP